MKNLGNEVGYAMAKNEFIAGIGSQRPFDQGIAEARLAALVMIGAETPPLCSCSIIGCKPLEFGRILSGDLPLRGKREIQEALDTN